MTTATLDLDELERLARLSFPVTDRKWAKAVHAALPALLSAAREAERLHDRVDALVGERDFERRMRVKAEAANAQLREGNARLREALTEIEHGMYPTLDPEDGLVEVWQDADDLRAIARAALTGQAPAAQDAEAVCPDCRGRGYVVIEMQCIGDSPSQERCETCAGEGWVYRGTGREDTSHG
jgi:hypothetical protein